MTNYRAPHGWKLTDPLTFVVFAWLFATHWHSAFADNGADAQVVRIGGATSAQAALNGAVKTVSSKQQRDTGEQQKRPFLLSDLLVSGEVIAHPEPTSLFRELEQAFQAFDSKVRDYTALMVKRERLGGHLSSHQFATLKVREPRSVDGIPSVPQSVYLKFLRPRFLAGREILYVEDQRDGRLLARKGGMVFSSITTILPIDHPLATCESAYKITDAGLRFTFEQAMETLRANMDQPDNRLVEFEPKQLDGRECRHFELRLAERSSEVPYQFVRLLFDVEWKLPIYVATYGWETGQSDASNEPAVSAQAGDSDRESLENTTLDRRQLQRRAKARLLEEFWFTKIKLNPGLSGEDFSPTNPDYAFKLKAD